MSCINPFHCGKKLSGKEPGSSLSVEMAYRTNLKLYTSEDLNHKKFYKPSEKIKQRLWYSARKQTCSIIERNQFPAKNERARMIKRFSGNFSFSVSLLPAKPEFFCHNNRYPQSPVTGVRFFYSTGNAEVESTYKERGVN